MGPNVISPYSQETRVWAKLAVYSKVVRKCTRSGGAMGPLRAPPESVPLVLHHLWSISVEWEGPIPDPV